MERYFHSELNTLRSQITLMGSKAAEAAQRAVQSLLENDLELAEAVIRDDAAIDELEIEIDREATRYISLRAPVASDLRVLTVAIKASHDLERVGDEAKIIAKKTRRILRRTGVHGELFEIPAMARHSDAMIRKALQCFVEGDHEKAREILLEDDEVDRLDKHNLKSLLRASKNRPEAIENYVDLIFVSKSLERIADHATNLAEEIIYMTTAEEIRHLRS